MSRFKFELDAETLGRLFMGRAGSFEVVNDGSVIQEQFVLDSVTVESRLGTCRLLYSEWEEESGVDKGKWVSEYAIELQVDDLIAFATYSMSCHPDTRDAAMRLDRVKLAAENDFILCAKLLGKSVRRDLVVDESMPDIDPDAPKLH